MAAGAAADERDMADMAPFIFQPRKKGNAKSNAERQAEWRKRHRPAKRAVQFMLPQPAAAPAKPPAPVAAPPPSAAAEPPHAPSPAEIATPKELFQTHVRYLKPAARLQLARLDDLALAI